ncbi:muscarinic acetylcholine receptor M1 isoform X2 [Stigmatopora nigra]
MEETSRTDPPFISTAFDASYQDVAILSGCVDGWSIHQSNESHIFRHERNATESPGNRTLIQASGEFDPLGDHKVWQVIVIVLLTGSLSLLTIVGNILVLLSFKINKALKTVNNYYLLSLAFADLTIGTLSMNLYTTYIIMNQWALGPVICDLWLAIDYVASNASVMNLLVISFDRYFSVTRPLTYRAKRTTKRAMTMICLAWSTSFILWAPAILFWQYIVDEMKTKRTTEKKNEFNHSLPSDLPPENNSLKDVTTMKTIATKAKMASIKRKSDKKANDKKAARTLSAILLAFITTWLPYNIMVLVNTFCENCIPENLWALGYWLCYVNSTVNPMCYALCNKTFRNTFKSILMCQWNQNKSRPQFNKRNAEASRKKDTP